MHAEDNIKKAHKITTITMDVRKYLWKQNFCCVNAGGGLAEANVLSSLQRFSSLLTSPTHRFLFIGLFDCGHFVCKAAYTYIYIYNKSFHGLLPERCAKLFSLVFTKWFLVFAQYTCWDRGIGLAICLHLYSRYVLFASWIFITKFI